MYKHIFASPIGDRVPGIEQMMNPWAQPKEQTQRWGDDGSETMTYERSLKEQMHVDLGGESRERHVSCNKIYEGLYGTGRICFAPCGPVGGNFRDRLIASWDSLLFLHHQYLWIITPKYFWVLFLHHFSCQSLGSDPHLNLLGCYTSLHMVSHSLNSML